MWSILRISPYSVRMWENADQKNFEYGHFSRSYNQPNENWREPVFEKVTKVLSVAFKEILSKTELKNLLAKFTLGKL